MKFKKTLIKMGTTLGLCSGLLLAGKTDKVNAAYTYYSLTNASLWTLDIFLEVFSAK